MTVANNVINPKEYAGLLAKALPTVIKTEEENERVLAEIEKLMEKGEGMSPEESALLELMSQLVDAYEDEAYPVRDAAPHEVLRHLMEANGLRQADLVPVLGSRGHVSDIVNGKRGISKRHAKSLGEFFHVSPELFI